MPAQPAKPAEPKKPFEQTGGYVQPPPPTRNAGPLPGGAPPAPTPGAPSSSAPGAAPSSVRTNAVQTSPVGVPPQAAQIGLDEEGYNQVLEEAKEAPEPEEFKTQFATLMEQRSMIAPRTQGGGLPTEEYGKYLKDWVEGAVAYGTTPTQMGGLGYTKGQAKMMAVMEARKRWPDIDGKYWTQVLPKGEVTPSDLGVAYVGKEGEKQAFEVGPSRAANLDPTKIADILTKKEFKTANEWAAAYKERAGAQANAAGFVKDVFTTQVSNMQAGGAKLEAEYNKAKAAFETADAQVAAAEAAAMAAGVDLEVTPTEEYQAAQLAKAQANAALQAAEAKKLSDIPDETGAMERALKFISENQDVLAVASSLNQLY